MTIQTAYFIFLNGVTQAALLFVISSGLALIFGLMKIVNLAHGAFYLMAAFVGHTILARTGNWWVALLGTAILMGIFCLILQISLFKKALNQPMIGTLLSLGLSILIIDQVVAFSHGLFQTIVGPSFIARTYDIGIVYPGSRLAVLVAAIIKGVLMYLLISKTKLGQIIRAGVNDKSMVAALGIDISKIFIFVFLLAGILVGLGGVLGGTMQAFGVSIESNIQMLALMVIIVGGQGSVFGAAVAALLIGMAGSVTMALVPNMSSVIVFSIVLSVLVYRPQGFFGMEGRTR